MKVVFKLNPAQLLIATAYKALAEAAHAANVAAYAADRSSGSPEMCGNCACTVDYGYGVREQSLTLNGTTLTYEGGRNALGAGTAGCLAIIEKIFRGVKPAEQAILEYSTSQPYLAWFMTELDGIEWGRASFDRLLELAREYRENDNYTTRAARKKLIEMLPDGFEKMSRVKRSAQFTSVELTKFAAIEAALDWSYDPDEPNNAIEPNPLFSDDFVEVDEGGV